MTKTKSEDDQKMKGNDKTRREKKVEKRTVTVERPTAVCNSIYIYIYIKRLLMKIRTNHKISLGSFTNISSNESPQRVLLHTNMLLGVDQSIIR